MFPNIRIADGLLTQTAERLITTAGAIINGMTGNPYFPAPPVDLKTVQAAVDDLNAALAAQQNGGPAATAEKKNKQKALIALLRRLRRYVEDNCGNDLSILLSSGFQAAVSTRVRSPLANPSILNVRFGNSILFFFLNHGDSLRPALPGANAASFAVDQVRFKIPICVLPNTALGAEEIAHTTLYAFLAVEKRPLGAPGASLVLSGVPGLSYYRPRQQVFPRKLVISLGQFFNSLTTVSS
jgi:hypothetical protein